jgi:hypothetical protein
LDCVPDASKRYSKLVVANSKNGPRLLADNLRYNLGIIHELSVKRHHNNFPDTFDHEQWFDHEPWFIHDHEYRRSNDITK